MEFIIFFFEYSLFNSDVYIFSSVVIMFWDDVDSVFIFSFVFKWVLVWIFVDIIFIVIFYKILKKKDFIIE